ncbi:MAG: rhodanese-like domain-containing protein [Planctomycetaceae bacterium]|nr:rhodanese-like domain-containing protein [Planctomycetaceae bacterium]
MTITTDSISVQELDRRLKEGNGTLIDVRTPVEFREVHAEPAKNVPLDRLDPRATMEKHGNSEEPLYIICRSGNRSSKACEAFRSAGYSNVINVEGGTQAWEQAGLPVKRGKKTISLERQVRIAAGSLVLTGAVLGYFVHEYWIGLSAFVGAGLIFAGITDTCGMGLLLARMPWNQCEDESCSV